MGKIEESVLGWIIANWIKNERGDLVEFDEHYFLLEPFGDWNPKQVCMKSAQVGWSTLAILKTLYGLTKRKLNCIYTLPAFDDVHDFVPAKVDGMVTQNPVLAALLGKSDAVTKKEFGGNFIWYRGTHGKKAAIMHTSDLNCYDEYDASNIEVIDLYASRLQRSKYKGEWMFSNPIRPGGIDQRYEMSDQKHWMIRCSACNKWQKLDYFENVDKVKGIYICSNCGKELSEDDRHDGEWVTTYKDREIHGYHVNQLMCSWVKAADLVYLERTKGPHYFYNMVLGLPYVEKDDVVDRLLIEKNILADTNPMLRNAMGVDVAYKDLHYVLGNHAGVFKVGIAKSWSEIEQMMRKYDPVTVIDANQDFYPRRILMPKYPGKVFCSFYRQNFKRKELFEWGKDTQRGYVYTDRSQAISAVVNDFTDGKILFTTNGRLPQSFLNSELALYVKHWENIYRIIKEDSFGIPHTSWEKSGEDHFVHATVYYKMALERVPRLENSIYDRIGPGGLYNPTIEGDGIPADKIPILSEEVDPDAWIYV